MTVILIVELICPEKAVGRGAACHDGKVGPTKNLSLQEFCRKGPERGGRPLA
jgi:hypothetical protein